MKWLVQMEEKTKFSVEVEAEDYSEAEKIALCGGPYKILDGSRTVTDAHVKKQLNGPWVRGDWYDLHGPGDVVLCTRAYGHRLVQSEVDALAARLTSLGLKVVDHWNGAGQSSVSFQCAGRKGTEPMNAEQLAVLNAPLP